MFGEFSLKRRGGRRGLHQQLFEYVITDSMGAGIRYVITDMMGAGMRYVIADSMGAGIWYVITDIMWSMPYFLVFTEDSEKTIWMV